MSVDSVLPLVAQMRIILSISNEKHNAISIKLFTFRSTDSCDYIVARNVSTFWMKNEQSENKKKIIHKIQYTIVAHTQWTRLSIEWFKTVDVGCDRAAWQPTKPTDFLSFIYKTERFLRKLLQAMIVSDTVFKYKVSSIHNSNERRSETITKQQ